MPTTLGHDLCAPYEVSDPEDKYLKDIFKGIGAFPSDPFSSKHNKVLRELGMKTKDSIYKSTRYSQSIRPHSQKAG